MATPEQRKLYNARYYAKNAETLRANRNQKVASPEGREKRRNLSLNWRLSNEYRKADHRAALMANPDDPRHGTAGGYSNYKCRCERCKFAWNASCVKWKNQRVSEFVDLPGTQHGISLTWSRGCRCAPCRDAMVRPKKDKPMLSRDELVKKNGGEICRCCGANSVKLNIDHVHGTKIIRGLLCTSCNTAIGKLGDTLAGVQRAVDYLKMEPLSPEVE